MVPPCPEILAETHDIKTRERAPKIGPSCSHSSTSFHSLEVCCILAVKMKQYLQYLAATLPLMGLATAQLAGDQQAETHPKITWSKCSGPGSCSTVDASVVIDANWRWLHDDSGTNCYDGNEWTDACSSADECAEVCAIEGADYDGTYGASTSGDSLSLTFLTEHEYGTNIGSRFYLMNGDDKYQMFTLMGNEFAFDVDLSTVECGLNSALYFVAMEEDGGMASYPSNQAGAKYGTGVSRFLPAGRMPAPYEITD